MIGRIFGVLCLISIFFGIYNNNMVEVGNAVLDGASAAVTLSISLLGMMCLWNGIMKVLQSAGAISLIAKIISPILKIIFPTAYKTGNGIDAIAANISANLLGIGNASTPFAIKAMEEMQKDNEGSEYASDDMITFAIMNTSAVNLLPTTILALRRNAGSADPYIIILPIWICSVCCWIFAVVLARLFAVAMPKKVKNKAYLKLNNKNRLKITNQKVKYSR